jgi:Na+/melibiose symporter-like transporter
MSHAGDSWTRPRVPLSVKLCYGAGSTADGVKNAAFNTFLLYYETNVLGLPGGLAGLSVFIAMCFDAVSDPLMGSFSDHFRSRWGRRHPFMYAAALPTAVSFYLLLDPPDGLGTGGLFTWLTVMSVLVRLALTLHLIPSDALAPELTSNYDERTSLVAFRFLFGWGGALGFSLLGWLVFFPAFAGGRNDPAAYVPLALVGAVMSFVSIVVCATGTHRLIPTLRRPESVFSVRRFVADVRNALANFSYRMILIATIFGAVAMGFAEAFQLYMGTYFWEFDDDDQAVLVMALAVALVIALPAARWISLATDKRRAALGLVAFAIAAGGLPIYARFLGWLPANGDPRLLVVIAGHSTLVIAAVIAGFILMSSMIQDAVDENDLETGERQEGVFVSAVAFTGKAVSGFGNLLGGIALQLIDFPIRAAPGTVPQNKVDLLGWAVGPGLMLLYAVAFLFLRRYRITRERHREILAGLAARAS